MVIPVLTGTTAFPRMIPGRSPLTGLPAPAVPAPLRKSGSQAYLKSLPSPAQLALLRLTVTC